MEPTDQLEDLNRIMDRLRDPGGCPWDREQDYGSLRRYLLEECYEVAQAIDEGDREALREELGDLLFQIVFLSRLAREEGRFALGDVIRGVAGKLIRRHPHVFGDGSVRDAREVERNWDRIKQQEKRDSGNARPAPSRLDGIPRALPALQRSLQLGERAARVGFDWKRPEQVLDKADEELGELRRALEGGDSGEVCEEIGDALFTLAMLARHAGVDAEAALERTNAKFERRFRHVERRAVEGGRGIEDAAPNELERWWDEAKLSEQKD